ncbi:reduction in Cnn dots 1 [Haemaphysalis longicornis]
MCAHHYHYGDGRASSAETYLHRLSGQEREPHIVSMDHSYAKAWNAHPDSHHAKPARLLFMKDVFFSEGKTPEQVAVNVESWKAVASPPYDGSKTRNLMGECERSAALSARPDSSTWDESVKRVGWSCSQHRLFNHVTRLLHADRMARLAYKGNANEPVLRRLAVDRTARRLRRIMGAFGWDMKLLQWLHQLLMEKTSFSYLAAYLDALQALRAQVPQLVDRLVARSGGSLGLLLRRPWDPVAPFLSQHKPKRLPCSPLLLLCPGAPVPRAKFWTSQLAVLGKLVSVGSPAAASAGALAPALEALVAATRAKVLELKNHFSSRPIILIGWMVGGLVACQVSLLESVAAVVCLGFPLVGLSGSRDVDDPLLDSPTATLFVVGQNALSCGMDELENFREHMKAESGLVVVGGADDSLHMCGLKKRLEGVTQAMVDRCVLDEVGAFLHGVLSAPHMGPAGASKARQRSSPASSRRVARRRGRQCRPYFYQQPGSGGSSSTDTTPGSSPTTILAATGANTKRGRRVGRPPKQPEKPARPRPAPPAATAGPARRRAPAPEEPAVTGDLMPTSSLWSQSLIDSPLSPPPGGEGVEQPTAGAREGEGKFVSLAEAGIRTSLLQKRGKPAQKPVCKMLLPASLSMVVASEPALDSSALEMLAEASSSQAKMASRAAPGRPRVPSSATTRTRKVRVPRFYDS